MTATPTRALPSPLPTDSPTRAALPFTPVLASAAAPSPTPSPLLGSWAFRAETGEHPIGGDLRFSFEGSEPIGFYVGPSGKATRLISLQVSGGQISFDIVGPLGNWHLVGKIAGDRMAGTFETVTRTISWIAVHKPATTPTHAAPPSPGTAPR
ncbi:MAG TPA: hypothetical protein VK780_00095 [Thermoanaerobaculia bacterium]|nr:hypothetical protein [Thermoanaerobaculia bacterium]